MDFFKVTEQDIAAASGKIPWKGGELPTLTITAIKEKEINGEKALLVECMVSNCDPFNGLQHTYFINKKPSSTKEWISILRLFFDDIKIASGTLSPVDLQGKKFVAAVKKRAYEGKEFTNLAPIKALSDVPETGSGSIPSNLF